MDIKKRFPRSRAVIIFLIASLFLILIKLFLIQVFRSEYLSELADRQHNLFLELEPTRGIIFDRNLRPLSLNLPVKSLFAVPAEVDNKEGVVKQVSNLLGLSREYLENRLNRKKFFMKVLMKLRYGKFS